MKNKTALKPFPSKCYFTLVDRESVVELKRHSFSEAEKIIERNLKVALLFQEQVIFRAKAALELESNAKLFTNYKRFTQDEILVAEVRHNDASLKQQYISKSPVIIELAEMLDQSTTLGVDAELLADDRSKELEYQLCRLLYLGDKSPVPLNRSANWDNISELRKQLYATKSPPDRKLFMKGVLSMFANEKDGLRLIQSIYFGRAAGKLNANPIWSRATDPKLHQSFWESKTIEPSTLSKQGSRVLGGSNLLELIEKRRNIVMQSHPGVVPEEIAESSHITSSMIDLLDIDDIYKLRETTVGKSVRHNFSNIIKHLNATHAPSELVGLYGEQFSKEQKRHNKVSNVLRYTGIGLSALGCIPKLGIMCAAGAAVLSLAEKEIKQQLTPLYSFSEMVREKELKE